MQGGETQYYEWSKSTLEVLGRVFKTFKIASHTHTGTLPKHLDTSEDLNSIEQTSFLSANITAERVTINKIQEYHDTCLEGAGAGPASCKYIGGGCIPLLKAVFYNPIWRM